MGVGELDETGLLGGQCILDTSFPHYRLLVPSRSHRRGVSLVTTAIIDTVRSRCGWTPRVTDGPPSASHFPISPIVVICRAQYWAPLVCDGLDVKCERRFGLSGLVSLGLPATWLPLSASLLSSPSALPSIPSTCLPILRPLPPPSSITIHHTHRYQSAEKTTAGRR